MEQSICGDIFLLSFLEKKIMMEEKAITMKYLIYNVDSFYISQHAKLYQSPDEQIFSEIHIPKTCLKLAVHFLH